jgi:hypothetical protein
MRLYLKDSYSGLTTLRYFVDFLNEISKRALKMVQSCLIVLPSLFIIIIGPDVIQHYVSSQADIALQDDYLSKQASKQG